jgi:hypothetical protein
LRTPEPEHHSPEPLEKNNIFTRDEIFSTFDPSKLNPEEERAHLD